MSHAVFGVVLHSFCSVFIQICNQYLFFLFLWKCGWSLTLFLKFPIRTRQKLPKKKHISSYKLGRTDFWLILLFYFNGNNSSLAYSFRVTDKVFMICQYLQFIVVRLYLCFLFTKRDPNGMERLIKLIRDILINQSISVSSQTQILK